MSDTGARSIVTPGRIIVAAAILIVIAALFAPGKDYGVPFSSTSASASGTLALYETLHRLGYNVERRKTSLADSLDRQSAYFILGTGGKLTSSDHDSIVHAVRAGATLVFTADDEALVDSLGFELSGATDRFASLRLTAVAGGNPPDPHTGDYFTVASFPLPVRAEAKPVSSGDVFMWIIRFPSISAPDSAAADTAPESLPDSLTVHGVRAAANLRAVILGRKVGQGYAVLIATPELVTNQLLSDRRPAVAIVRALERANPMHGRVVFDEYDHGAGPHADPMGAVVDALTDTTLGRMTLQAAAAALILMLVVAVRPLAPLPTPSITRRSPLEHVGALAHAYRQVDARTLGAERLVHGLRRRHSLGIARAVPDSVYLGALRTRIPAAADDVDRIAQALTPDSSLGIATIGDAVANIERKFKGD